MAQSKQIKQEPASADLQAKADKPSEDALRLHPFYRGKVQLMPKCPIRGPEDFAVFNDDKMGKIVVHGDSNELFEYVDAWGNPLVYFHSRDYKKPQQFGSVKMGQEQGYEEVTAKPWKDEKTGRFKNPGDYQLFSAGKDGIFNTDDDIGNW